jgi:hypothetical protein
VFLDIGANFLKRRSSKSEVVLREICAGIQKTIFPSVGGWSECASNVVANVDWGCWNYEREEKPTNPGSRLFPTETWGSFFVVTTLRGQRTGYLRSEGFYEILRKFWKFFFQISVET